MNNALFSHVGTIIYVYLKYVVVRSYSIIIQKVHIVSLSKKYHARGYLDLCNVLHLLK